MTAPLPDETRARLAEGLWSVLTAWERDGESGEVVGSPADLYAEAEFIIASDWFADLITEATAERDATLGRVRALLPEPPPTDAEGMIHHDGGLSHTWGLQCDQCPNYPHSGCVPGGKVRAALDGGQP